MIRKVTCPTEKQKCKRSFQHEFVNECGENAPCCNLVVVFGIPWMVMFDAEDVEPKELTIGWLISVCEVNLRRAIHLHEYGCVVQNDRSKASQSLTIINVVH